MTIFDAAAEPISWGQRLRKRTFDLWSPLDYKSDGGFAVPLWSAHHGRRLLAYLMLHAFYTNEAVQFLQPPRLTSVDIETLTEIELERLQNRREFGDAHLLVHTITDAVLGREQKVLLSGQDEADATLADAVPPSLEWAQQWFKDERLKTKLRQCDELAVELGDGVYELSWDSKKKRVRCRVFEPDCYFPVLETDDADEVDYPSRVHLAWEFTKPDPQTGLPMQFLRRRTYELKESPDGPQRYPWGETDERECFLTDVTYKLPVQIRSFDDIEVGNWTDYWYRTNADGERLHELPLGINFIPVIHQPNTITNEHFGVSSLQPVLQVLDEIHATDTDLGATAAVAGSPIITVSGSLDSDVVVRPGAILETGDGTAGKISNADSLDALIKYKDDLRSRLAVNARLSSSLLGFSDTHKTGQVSGYAIALGFASMDAHVAELRLARDEKDPLIFKFSYRLTQAAGELPAGEVPEFRLARGSWMPANLQDTLDTVTRLRAMIPPAISLETAVRMLADAGLPITDIPAELARIEHRDFTGAGYLTTALGPEGVQYVLDYLGLEPDEIMQQQIEQLSQPPQPPQLLDQNGNPVGRPPELGANPPRNRGEQQPPASGGGPGRAAPTGPQRPAQGDPRAVGVNRRRG